MTNFERIKAMSLDEMAERIAANGCHNCVYVFSEDPCRGRCTEGTRMCELRSGQLLLMSAQKRSASVLRRMRE